MSESRSKEQPRATAPSRSKVLALRAARPGSKATRKAKAAPPEAVQPPPAAAPTRAAPPQPEPSFRTRAAEARRQAADYLQRLREERLGRQQRPAPAPPAPEPRAAAKPPVSAPSPRGAKAVPVPAPAAFADEFPPGFKADAPASAPPASAKRSGADPVRTMQIEDVPAFGPALKRKLASLGIHTLQDLSRHPEAQLRKGLGPASRLVAPQQLIQFAKTVCREA